MNAPLNTRRLSMAILALLVALSACSIHHPGEVTDISVTGTDGKTTDPAELTPTENLGQFYVNYGVEPGDQHTRLTLLTRSRTGEEVSLDEICCDNNGCGNGRFSCTYDASEGVTCDTNHTSLNTFFIDSGGLPNTARMVVRSVTNDCDFALFGSKNTTSRDTGVVYH